MINMLSCESPSLVIDVLVNILGWEDQNMVNEINCNLFIIIHWYRTLFYSFKISKINFFFIQWLKNT